MKKIWKRIGSAILVLILAIGCFSTVPAFADGDAAWPDGIDVPSPCAIVMEASTGTVLYEKNADEAHYPASITKIMTTMLAIENRPLDEIVTFSADAVFKNEGDTSHIARDYKEQMTLEQCLYGIMLESANECAYAVAEHVCDGDYEAFIDMMNDKAAELGCTNTHFCNANGLPDEQHLTSCRDMALISQEAIKLPQFRTIISTPRYTIPPTNKHSMETPLNNHHQLISAYKGRKYLYENAIGGKTGYTVAAGSTLVTYAEKDGMLLICVIMNSKNTHFQDTINLFEYCFNHFQMSRVAQAETRLGEPVRQSGLVFQNVDAFAQLDSEAQIVLPKGVTIDNTETSVRYDNTQDNVVGTLVYTYDGREVGSADVVVTGASGKTFQFDEVTDEVKVDMQTPEVHLGLGDKVRNLLQNLVDSENMILKIIILIVIAVVLLLILLVVIPSIQRNIRRRKRRKKRYRVIQENRKHKNSEKQ